MKISYNTKIFYSDGSVYKQRIKITHDMMQKIDDAIRAEIATDYPRHEEYTYQGYLYAKQGYLYAKMYLKPLKLEKHNVYMNITQTDFCRMFIKDKRFLRHMNTYLCIV
jgi:hypothetical protein